MKKSLLALFILFFQLGYSQKMSPQDTEVWQPIPKLVTPGKTVSDAPSDAIVLFDGKDLSAFESILNTPANWKVEDGIFTVRKLSSNIRTKQSFGSMQLHVEWRSPLEIKGEGQDRGNSGIFLMGNYEIQVLDCYNNPTYANGQAGSVYKQIIPLVNACKKSDQWQTYDIIFTAPKFAEDGKVLSPARVTVFHNGVLVQNNVEIKGTTVFVGQPEYKKHGDKEPIVLQNHMSEVSYRNIWVREL